MEEKNGKGKEYYNFENENHKKCIKFEGKYLNGEKSGKGIKYYTKNGEGIVKKYNRTKHIKYEGHYLNGQKNGFGTEYDFKNDIQIFSGEYLNGKRWNSYKVDDKKILYLI